MKIWAWMAVGLVAVLPSYADDGLLFTVHLKNGNGPYKFEFAQQPNIVFGEDGLEVQTADVEFKLPSTSFADIDRIEFESDDSGETTDLEEKVEVVPMLRFQFLDGQTVVIDGVRGDVLVSQHSIDGKAVAMNVERQENRLVVHLNHLPKGIYILKIDNQSFKISKKS